MNRRKLLGLVGTAAISVAAGRHGPAVFAQSPALTDAERTRDRIVAAVRAFDRSYALPLPAVQQIRPIHDVAVAGVEVSPDQLPLIDTFVGDLQLRYSFDSASRISSVSAADLRRLNLKREALLALAVANFRRRYAAFRVERMPRGLSSVTNAGELEPSLMLDSGFWDLERQRARTDLIAAVPARDTLIFTHRNDDQLGVLRQLAVHVYGTAGDDAVSRNVFLWKSGRWESLS